MATRRRPPSDQASASACRCSRSTRYWHSNFPKRRPKSRIRSPCRNPIWTPIRPMRWTSPIRSTHLYSDRCRSHGRSRSNHPVRNGSIESTDGVGVRVEIVGIFGHYSRNSCEDSETASKSRDDARSIRKRGRNSPRFRHRRRNERRELLRSPAIRLFTVNFYRNRPITSNICRLSLALCGFN